MELLKKSRAFLLLFVTFFFWGSVYVGGKLISDDVPAPLLGCLRCFVASFPLMLMARKHFGVKIDRAAVFKGTQRAKQIYEDMVAAAEALLALVKTRRGNTNKDNAKLTGQIVSLIEKWKK